MRMWAAAEAVIGWLVVLNSALPAAAVLRRRRLRQLLMYQLVASMSVGETVAGAVSVVLGTGQALAVPLSAWFCASAVHLRSAVAASTAVCFLCLSLERYITVVHGLRFYGAIFCLLAYIVNLAINVVVGVIGIEQGKRIHRQQTGVNGKFRHSLLQHKGYMAIAILSLMCCIFVFPNILMNLLQSLEIIDRTFVHKVTAALRLLSMVTDGWCLALLCPKLRKEYIAIFGCWKRRSRGRSSRQASINVISTPKSRLETVAGRRRRRAAASSDDDRLAAFARDLSDSWYSDLPPKLDAGGVSTSNANKKSTFIRLFSHRRLGVPSETPETQLDSLQLRSCHRNALQYGSI
ncbi:hypothetical protein FJT64_025107 [Amphibalanus amphitrite]|uniref:G-protein coupled receptors family 1 profile domain-containing protein n=1 Tax=Amphibalanus amphitrite TaxID=1232801 RepID=A0A6A4WG82_AMPAM|nr:hypothetical protein FJT64_025107 [Amphibalanus amphitrite]